MIARIRRAFAAKPPKPTETMAHDELIRRLGYERREAEIRLRRAQPPKLR